MRSPECLGLCLLLVPGLALGAEATMPRLTLAGCSSDMAVLLERQLGIELLSLRSELERARSFSELEIRVRCDRNGVELEVGMVGLPATAARHVDTTGAPVETHPRLVALAAGELIYGALSRLDQQATHPAAAPVSGASEPKPSRTQSSGNVRRVHVLAFGGVRRMGRPAAWLGAFGIALDFAPWRALALATDTQLNLGTVELETVNVRVMGLTAAVFALVGQHGGRSWWGIGPGARLGWMRLAGEPTQPGLRGETLSGSWGGAGLMARWLYAPPGWPIVLAMALEGGFVTLPIKATRDRSSELFALEGEWLGATIRVGW